jgi:hypothetical protein
MNNILLEVDASVDSLAALDVAVSLTRSASDIMVIPQYVIDTAAIWKFLGMEKPGLVGSGPHFQAFDSIKICLKELAETILQSYRARCDNLQCFADVTIDEGDWLSTVAAKAHLLKAVVLVGKYTLTRVAKEKDVTPEEIARSINHPLVIIDKDRLSCGCFPVLTTEPSNIDSAPRELTSCMLRDLFARVDDATCCQAKKGLETASEKLSG